MSQGPNFELELTPSMCDELGISQLCSTPLCTIPIGTLLSTTTCASSACTTNSETSPKNPAPLNLPKQSGYSNLGFLQRPKDITVVSKWTEDEKKNEISNMIVCVRKGVSYDPVFQHVQPNIPNGRAITYLISHKAAADLLKALETKEPTDDILDIYNYIQTLKPEDIVFYFECCEGCLPNNSHDQLARRYRIGSDNVKLIAHLVRKKKIMVLCADFSLKGLITDWDDELLGPNPFVNVGETSGKFTLEFDIDTLKNSKSTQMQSLGKLVDTGTVDVKAMSNTIVYNVNTKENIEYVPQVLTIVKTNTDNIKHVCTTSDGKHTGHAGQVMLHYKDEGILMTSNGHFAELARLDVSLEKFLAYTTAEYGAETSATYSQSMSVMTNEERAEFIRTTSARMVSSDIPCMRTVSEQPSGQPTEKTDSK